MDGGAARQVYCAPQRQWEDPGIHPFLTKTKFMLIVIFLINHLLAKIILHISVSVVRTTNI